ncbi:unnamed protein product [Rotaria sordida]|uniref:Major facilitator superfamily associated domain-containing protein n=1 Tax=Rotaria sordida TaxID=392033 RepID=A0A814PYH4_9BILA|nr:unnamed protein product [Rotaria sordida]CAF1112069.1 unnamed protein product [Rotaria sordida]CAF1148417.1 unnamed protein product [Rotaria sordida]CAF1148725.1 unnamed protein product [Rotaria sordida]CAF1384838.1 unnamed protein product [Rotaria sordida]
MRLKRDILASGWAFISADYRLLIPCTGYDILADVNSLFAYLASDQLNRDLDNTSHRLDPSRLAVGGASAGAYVAYLAGIHARPKPRAVFGLYGIGGRMISSHYYSIKSPMTVNVADFRHYLNPIDDDKELLRPTSDAPLAWPIPEESEKARTSGALFQVFIETGTFLDFLTGIRGFSESLRSSSSSFDYETQVKIPDEVRCLFPELHVAAFPPTYLVHGTADQVALVEESKFLAQQLELNHIPHVLALAEDRGHGFNAEADADEVYDNFAAIGPILNITLRNRGLSDIEISCINLINPFLIFFTNPLLAFFADHIRRFRLTFNIILCLITIVFSIIFFLPTLKSYSIQGEIYQIDTMKYSLTFCANKEFSTKCALRTRCGCTYQAYCRLLTMEKIYFNKSIPIKTFHFNFTMNSTYVDKQYKNVSIRSNKLRICSAINYHVSIDKDTNDEIRDLFDNSSALSSSEYFKLATCDIKCSIDHLCHGSRYSHQILYLLLYSFLMIIGLNLFALATTLGTTIAFSTLHHSNLFGRQRAWGTIGSGISAFFVSRLYVHFKTKYVYLITFIACSFLSIISTSFIRIRSDKCKRVEPINDDTHDRTLSID